MKVFCILAALGMLATARGDGHAAKVQAGWNNHFAAFGTQNVTMILDDYTEESQIIVYNANADVATVYEGIAGATMLFNNLFAQLTDLTTLGIPYLQVDD